MKRFKKQNRAYKKGAPFRDANYIIVVCEGAKREVAYFEALAGRSQRVKVRVFSPSENKSAPKWMLDKAVRCTEDFNLTKDDQVWRVMDIDRWEQTDLHAIQQHCSRQTETSTAANWILVLSNPCFEVWLLLHVKERIDAQATCKKLKTQLGKALVGGFEVHSFAAKAGTAVQHAVSLDQAEDYFPLRGTTKW